MSDQNTPERLSKVINEEFEGSVCMTSPDGKGKHCIFCWTDCDGKYHQEKVPNGESIKVKVMRVVDWKETCVEETWKCKLD